MGEIADDMIFGYSCTLCGQYFEKEHGFPVICQECWDDLEKEERTQYVLATQKTIT